MFELLSTETERLLENDKLVSSKSKMIQHLGILLAIEVIVIIPTTAQIAMICAGIARGSFKANNNPVQRPLKPVQKKNLPKKRDLFTAKLPGLVTKTPRNR